MANIFAKPNLAVSQIPGSTSADNGKVLKVGESGIPEWGEGGSSGSGVLVAHATVALADVQSITPGSPVLATLDKTYEELAAAEDSVVIVEMTSGDTVAATAVFRLAVAVTEMSMLHYTIDAASELLLDGEPYDLRFMATPYGCGLMALPASSVNIPDAPTTDGSYTLTCTVSDGEASYSWVSAT